MKWNGKGGKSKFGGFDRKARHDCGCSVLDRAVGTGHAVCVGQRGSFRREELLVRRCRWAHAGVGMHALAIQGHCAEDVSRATPAHVRLHHVR